MDRVFGTDLPLRWQPASGGAASNLLADIVIGSSGDLAPARGEDNYLQALNIRMRTEQGSPLLHPSFGVQMSVGGHGPGHQASCTSLRQAVDARGSAHRRSHQHANHPKVRLVVLRRRAPREREEPCVPSLLPYREDQMTTGIQFKTSPEILATMVAAGSRPWRLRNGDDAFDLNVGSSWHHPRVGGAPDAEQYIQIGKLPALRSIDDAMDDDPTSWRSSTVRTSSRH